MPTITTLNNKIEAFGRISEKNSITPHNVATLLLEIIEIIAETQGQEQLQALQQYVSQKVNELRAKDAEIDSAISALTSQLEDKAESDDLFALQNHFRAMSSAEYIALRVKDPDTFYFIYE